MTAKVALKAVGQRVLCYADSLCRPVPLPTQPWVGWDPGRLGCKTSLVLLVYSLEEPPAAGCHPSPYLHGLGDPCWVGWERKPPWTPVPLLARRVT